MSKIADSMNEDSQAFNEIESKKPKYTEQEILEKMGHCSYQFEVATNFLIKYSSQVDKMRAKIRSKILSKSAHLIENDALKVHLETIFANEKLRLTKEDIEGFISIELGQIEEQINRAQVIAKNAEKAHEMWQKQLSWYQSVMKKETTEMLTLNRMQG